MQAPEPTFETLRDAHVAALTGSLIDGVEHGPGGAGYVWSRSIPDPTVNFAFGVHRPDQFAWAGAAALGRARAPAFLARDDGEIALLRALFEPAIFYPARWMVARELPAPAPAGSAVTVQATPAPGPDFERVFAHLSDAPGVRTHLRRYYIPALRAARGRHGLVTLHLVLRDAAGPAACASLYLRGETAGLYNVSTRADRQRRGLGTAVTVAALREARARGAAQVFLQCPADGRTEALYARAGFRTACAPTLLCTTPP
ncbi:N-acetylglutamate synthase, GNAT family [Methylobacterium sp. UNC300MFChir4.1]|uniref:GNAT family N-acetyltransferase n=1 Tax=Methylobacterium sp. UNC300MFChir4.1 TaxID=1502747 RepID=UPI0008CCA5BC|nr:GNAT family N-acetyltransferase [Methylobacterium sp. UNC300MFChir4.1]SEP29564.1 N-acetylglutamate synthase, GNAT family [Methylobacterium sp. UNC300MFChir4.1]